MAKPPGRHTPAVNPSRPDGTTHPEAIGLKDTTALTRKRHLLSRCGDTLACDHYEALFDPSKASALGLPEDARSVKLVRSPRITLAPQGDVRRTVVFTLNLFEVRHADGSCSYHAPLPEEIDGELRVSEALKALIVQLLGQHSLRAIRKLTLARRAVIETLAKRLPEMQRAAMAADDARPWYIAVDSVHLREKAGKDRPALHVVASDPVRGLHWPLALIDWKRGEAAVIRHLAQAILALPRPQDLLALVTDYDGQERRMVAEALALVQQSCPACRPRLVVDRFHVQKAFRDAMGRFRVKCWKQFSHGKSGRKLKTITAEAKRKVAAIKGAAYALEKVRKADLAEKIAASRRLEAAFEAEPQLKVAYDLLEGLRQVFDARTLAEAEARYAAWRQALAASGFEHFKGQADWLEKHWPQVRVYFEVLEDFDRRSNQPLKIGTNAAECLNREAKALWRQCKSAPISLIEQRLIARCGYSLRAARRAEPSVPPRRRPKCHD